MPRPMLRTRLLPATLLALASSHLPAQDLGALTPRVQVVTDVAVSFDADERFDIVLVDPPYALDPSPIVATLAEVVGDRLLLESAAVRAEPEVPPGLAVLRHRCYGDTAVRLYRRETA